MEYIINSWWFYWIDILDKMQIFCIFIGVLGAIASVAYQFYLNDTFDPIPKTGTIFAVICGVVFMIGMFIPSQETMYKMMVAQMATRQNVSMATDGARELIEFFTEEIVEIVDKVKED